MMSFSQVWGATSEFPLIFGYSGVFRHMIILQTICITSGYSLNMAGFEFDFEDCRFTFIRQFIGIKHTRKIVLAFRRSYERSTGLLGRGGKNYTLNTFEGHTGASTGL